MRTHLLSERGQQPDHQTCGVPDLLDLDKDLNFISTVTLVVATTLLVHSAPNKQARNKCHRRASPELPKGRVF
ncbi:hypothetical protein MKX08_002657 [Trichoderma sp. CBMAI-0020]|nr:hypothetical protein MKX08_002657 [Trichoderma sp. CBMAI-0020]